MCLSNRCVLCCITPLLHRCCTHWRQLCLYRSHFISCMPVDPSTCFPESLYYLNITPACYYKWHTDTSPNVRYFFWQPFPLTTCLSRPLNGLVVWSCPLFSQNSCCRLCWSIFLQFRLLEVLQWLPSSLKTETALVRTVCDLFFNRFILTHGCSGCCHQTLLSLQDRTLFLLTPRSLHVLSLRCRTPSCLPNTRVSFRFKNECQIPIPCYLNMNLDTSGSYPTSFKGRL